MRTINTLVAEERDWVRGGGRQGTGKNLKEKTKTKSFTCNKT
jgi:hypothetical protein